MLQWIYGREGYYIEWTKEVALLFSHKICEGESVVSEIVRASIQRGIFDQTIYEKYGILTSHGIQKRYFEVIKRRKNFEVDGRILLVDVTQILENVFIKQENVDKIEKNVNISKQSKVKESKVKESKVKRVADKPPTRDEIRTYAKERNSSVDPDKFFDYFDAGNWIDSEGKPVLSWKQKFITWEKKQNERSRAASFGNTPTRSEREFNIRYDNEPH